MNNEEFLEYAGTHHESPEQEPNVVTVAVNVTVPEDFEGNVASLIVVGLVSEAPAGTEVSDPYEWD